jgi:hypothetical protein
MKPKRQKTLIRMREARARVDDFEAAETIGSVPAAPNRRVALIVWACLIAVALAIYFFAAWYRQH